MRCRYHLNVVVQRDNRSLTTHSMARVPSVVGLLLLACFTGLFAALLHQLALFSISSIAPYLVTAVVLPDAYRESSQMLTEVDWHPPQSSWLNDLSEVINGAGVHGFHFAGSQLPAGVEYGTYNYCNMPHVRKQEYGTASGQYELDYVEVVS